MNSTRFLGLDCVELVNDSLRLLVTQSVGPRVLALQLHGKASPFAELPSLTIDLPGLAPWHFYGGHRLWQAPEVATSTYLPDDRPVEIKAVPNGLQVAQPVEPKTGLQKSLRIHLPDRGATVIVDHTLCNQGREPVSCAPWAISGSVIRRISFLPSS